MERRESPSLENYQEARMGHREKISLQRCR